MKVLYYVAFILVIFLSKSIFGQDLGNLKNEQPVKVSGSLGGSFLGYQASGIANRRDPFFWQLNGALNISLYGIDIPLSATFSQLNRRFTQPFNQFGLSPRYKSFTAHLGYRNLEFSPYTLSGNVFLGAGLEVSPEESPVKVTALYGRFVRAIAQGGVEGIVRGVPAYERWGQGVKMTLGKQENRSVDLIYFHAKDNLNSVPVTTSESLTPVENGILGFQVRQQFTKRFNFRAEYALSAFTNDIRFENDGTSFSGINRLAAALLSHKNLSSQVNSAINAETTYAADKYQLRLQYRRIDPDYKTLGSVFLNNDLEDVQASVSWRMFENKINVSAGGGFQRNNLSQRLSNEMTRLSGSFNISYTPNEKLNLSANYSNFSSATRVLLAATDFNNTQINPDSLSLLQITNSTGISANYNTGNERSRHILMSNFNFQGANDNGNSQTTFWNWLSSYQYTLMPTDLSLGVSFNVSRNISTGFENLVAGPTLTATKGLLKRKMRLNASGSLLNSYAGGELLSGNLNLRGMMSYRVAASHNMGINVMYLNRNSQQTNAPSFSELRAGVNYNYTFGF
ncbi:hypothetical protein [Rhodoflexus sp.]